MRSFDSGSLTYVDFLDALVRIAHSFPFTEEERGSLGSMDSKLQFLFKKLEAKYATLVEGFVETLKRKNKEMNYQPKVVVDDDAEGGDEYD